MVVVVVAMVVMMVAVWGGVRLTGQVEMASEKSSDYSSDSEVRRALAEACPLPFVYACCLLLLAAACRCLPLYAARGRG